MKLRLLLAQIVLGILLTLPGAHAAVITVSSDITADTTWTANNTYVLQTIVYVRNNSTLAIQPGTVIKAATTGLIQRTGIPNLVAALWITRGSKLYATGTVERPITFTFDGDDLTNPDDVLPTTSGRWGGIVLCGRARLNTANHATGGTSDPKFERFEGTSSDGDNQEHLFGGADDNDNSGKLQYVSIRYPGSSFAADREMNGLTMAAVGRATDISYVEVMNSSDDAFEWWGGSVNTHHLVAAFCEDDDFDTDQGYRGTNQFWFGIKPPWAGSLDSRGFETDGDLVQGTSGEQPKSQWTVHNATLIGRGKADQRFGGGVGWNSRDEAAPNVHNSIFAEFAQGLLLDSDGLAEFNNGQADLRNTIFDVTTASSANANFLFTDASRSNSVEAALLGSISYSPDLGLNPRPRNNSPAITEVGPQGAGLVQTAYRGAFSRRDHWADRWTAISQLGILNDGRTTINVNADITANTTWGSNTTMVLQTIVYVRNNATLTIEPGAVIKAATSGLIQRTGIPNLVAGLWVTRGSKLQAVGNIEQPIIFTFDGDNINDPYDVPPTTSGRWGGIVLCGRARINTANHATGGTSDPKFERFEGTSSDGDNQEHLFGGANDADDSGALRYVSIRYPGSSFAADREMNGLTMAAVGSATEISYVEVINSSDDAFEWWGGNVSTHHLVAAFCEDDDFDTDQGYRGNNQFWFGIKPPWAGSLDSRGFETDGDLVQGTSGEQPKSQWTVHNATLIGRGKTDQRFGGGVGWNSRDEAAPNVHNSIFAEFAQGLLLDADGLAEFNAGQADLRHTICDVTTGSSANANFLFTDASRSNSVEAVNLGSVSYSPNMLLNPRLRQTSPALSDVGPQPAPFETTTYRGAFSRTDLWAHKWTAIYDLGFLQGTWFPDGPVPPCNPNNIIAIASGTGDVTISWSSQSGKTYTVKSKASLSDPWADEETGIAGNGGTITKTYSSGSGNKFFAVVCN